STSSTASSTLEEQSHKWTRSSADPPSCRASACARVFTCWQSPVDSCVPQRGHWNSLCELFIAIPDDDIAGSLPVGGETNYSEPLLWRALRSRTLGTSYLLGLPQYKLHLL